MNTFSDVAVVWEPHFMTKCFRASIHNQSGKEWNYVIITCSPTWNGIWRYKAELKDNFSRVNNNKNVCLCVPIDSCEKYMELQDVKNPALQKLITGSQKDFCKKYRQKLQDWVIDYEKIQSDVQ